MAAPDELQPLAPPGQAAWASIGVVRGRELHGGHQSRVFAGQRNGTDVVVKLTDARLVDATFQRRLDVTAALAALDTSVVGPISSDSARADRLAVPLAGWLAVVFPFIAGNAPDVTHETDVRRMASALSGLHRSLGRLGPVDLPPLAALADPAPPADTAPFGRPQLLHGDYSHANLMFSDNGVRVIDFDDCGYGPIEFEIGNTLYMVLFDAALSSAMPRYERFRAWFVDEYRQASGVGVRDELLDRSIDLRIRALGHWVEHPETAPIGIRTATPEWRESLRAFVQSRTLR